MTAPVWLLSVNLEAKTATFQSGLADAARSARGAFTDISGGARKAGEETGYSMMEARHSVMMLGEEFGIRIPRALSSFIAGIAPIGAAMEAAFPFLAIATGAILLIEHLAKLKEEGEKLTEDQVKFGTAVQNAFNSLDEKLIQAQIRADELRNDHLGALKGELALIDAQSLQELVHQFDEVSKAADVVFADMQSHWYSIGIGSDGAKHALSSFRAEYDSLLAQHKDKEASGLLSGSLEQAQKVLALQKEAAGIKGTSSAVSFDSKDLTKTNYYNVMNQLKQYGVGITKDEVASQEKLVDTLRAQVDIEAKVAELKKLQGNNAKTQTGNEAGAMAAAGAKEAANAQQRLSELQLQADKAVANARLDIQQASIAERLASDLAFADRETQIQMTANAAEIAALDKSGKDYQNQLKALQDKALEIIEQSKTQEAEIRARASVEQNKKDVSDLEQSIREQIDATQRGTSERIAAIQAGIKQEEAQGLQLTDFYKQLQVQLVQAKRDEALEEAQLAQEAGKEAADNEQKMGELQLQARKQYQQLMDSAHRLSIAQQTQEATKAADEQYKIEMDAVQRKIATLDKSNKEYLNKLQELQDRETQLTRQHENELAAIKEQAQIQQNQQAQAGLNQLEDMTAQGLTQVIMRHQSFAAVLDRIGDQVVSGMIQNALKSMMALDMDKEKQAAAAARKFFNAGASFPFPVNLVMAPALAAVGFASVMAFEHGGIVPGVGRGDTVPAMLSPGEAVLPKGLTERLSKLESNSGSNGDGATQHLHYAPTYHVNVMDGDGLQGVLDKHSDQLTKHFENTIRRMNK